MSGTLKIGGKTLATHSTSDNKLAFHSDANDTGQLCRAWVNFDGVNQTIRASFNVSSISYATGDYTINFATAMPDANYSVNGNAKVDIGVRTVNLQPSSAHILAGSVRVYAVLNSDVGLYDSDFCFVTVFR
jgi:hypothetical protein